MIEAFLRFIQPLVKLISKLHWPFTHKKITGKEYYELRDNILPGTVFLTKTLGEFSNIINPSKIPHGAIYLGGDKIKYVVEAVGDGVRMIDLVSFLTSKDTLIIVRPKFAEYEQMKLAADIAHKKLGSPYDDEFEDLDDEQYCFELIISSYLEIFYESKFRKETILGKKVYTSNTFLKDTLNWEVIYDSRKE